MVRMHGKSIAFVVYPSCKKVELLADQSQEQKRKSHDDIVSFVSSWPLEDEAVFEHSALQCNRQTMPARRLPSHLTRSKTVPVEGARTVQMDIVGLYSMCNTGDFVNVL
jgi:hypothetical protein